MLSVFALLLLAAAPPCAANKTEIHGIAEHDGTLAAYPSDGSEPVTVKLAAAKPWSICLDSTDHGPLRPDGPYVPWFDEVHYDYGNLPFRHERWAIPKGAKSLPVESVITDGTMKQ